MATFDSQPPSDAILTGATLSDWPHFADSQQQDWIVSGPGLRDRRVVTPAVTAALCLACGALAGLFGSRVWIWLTIVGALAAVVAMAAAIWITLRRTRIRWDDEGLTIAHKGLTDAYRFDQVAGLAWDVRPWFVSGRRMGEARTLRLWLQQGSEEVETLLSDRFHEGERDPLAPLIRKLSRQRLNAVRSAVARGETIAGEGWRWNGEGIWLNAPRGASTLLASEEVAALDRLNGRLRLWAHDHVAPAATLDAGGRDVWVLETLLRERLPQTTEEVRPEEGLGRIVFERRPARGLYSALIGLGCGACIGGLALGLSGAARGADVLAAAGFVFVFLGLIAALSGWRMRRSHFRCCQRGMTSRGLGGPRELRFDEVDLFSFDMRRQRKQGRYAGTSYLIAAASSGQPQRGIMFSETAPHELEEFEWLRDRISEDVARRLAARLAAEGKVRWTRELTLSPEGIDFQPKGWVRRWDDAEAIPFDAIRDYEIRDGWFHLWTEGRERAALKVRTSDPNFYPGLILFERCESRVRETSPALAERSYPSLSE